MKMKFLLTILSVITFYTSKSQDYYERERPQMFDTFTSRLSIAWAANADDTLRFNNPNLSEILINRMEKKEIKTAYPIYNDKIEYTTKKDNHQMFYH